MIVVALTIEVDCARIVSVQAMHLAFDHQTNCIYCTRLLSNGIGAHFILEINAIVEGRVPLRG
jgi:hypothetical protein